MEWRCQNIRRLPLSIPLSLPCLYRTLITNNGPQASAVPRLFTHSLSREGAQDRGRGRGEGRLVPILYHIPEVHDPADIKGAELKYMWINVVRFRGIYADDEKKQQEAAKQHLTVISRPSLSDKERPPRRCTQLQQARAAEPDTMRSGCRQGIGQLIPTPSVAGTDHKTAQRRLAGGTAVHWSCLIYSARLAELSPTYPLELRKRVPGISSPRPDGRR